MKKIWAFITTEEFEKITGGIKMDKDYPIKKVSSDEDVIMNLAWENKQLKDLIKQFFELLDYTTTTDDGREFHPITIGCGRALMTKKLYDVLDGMKKASGYESSDSNGRV